MPCHEIKSWTFSALVGAFLDLSIATLLLCASTLAYLTSKFLGLFGLSLPCPCNGPFGAPYGDNCWQTALVHCPSQKISSVQFSVKNKFPFDLIWDKPLNPELSAILSNDKFCKDRCFQLDDETSCSSFQDRRSEPGSGIGSGALHGKDVKEDRFDMKGKGVSSQKARHALRRRRKGLTDNGRSSSVSTYDPSQLDSQAIFKSPASVSKMVNESTEGSTVPDGSSQLHARVSSTDMGLLGGESPDCESNGPINKNTVTQNDASYADDLKFNVQGKLSFDCNDDDMIRVLEQALEKEHATSTALYLELEKERSAAATAADEALAMILRLQEEKASIEMEARQYQRMIEEKSAYDFEELTILKEILIRREREKHFLEKEVETYRQMIFGSEQLDSDPLGVGSSCGKRESSLPYSADNPELMLREIGESICGKDKLENANKNYEDRFIELQDHTLTLGEKLSIPDFDEVDSSKLQLSGRKIDEEFKEMEALPLEKSPKSQVGEMRRLEKCSQSNLSTAERYNLQDDKTIAPLGEVQEQIVVTSASHESASKTIQACNETKDIFPCTSDDSKKLDKDSCHTMFNTDTVVPDDLEIEKKYSLSAEIRGNGSGTQSCNSPRISRSRTEQDFSRSCSDITSGFPAVTSSLTKPISDFRRNSMSAVDYERFKIDNEVGRLRERLRIVQEGRGKLNVALESKEKERNQLQLLENIVNQLQEIRQLTEPGKAVRQVSMPPPSCKDLSKKRRWRSVSLEVGKNT